MAAAEHTCCLDSRLGVAAVGAMRVIRSIERACAVAALPAAIEAERGRGKSALYQQDLLRWRDARPRLCDQSAKKFGGN
jgi:hypothetical protein